MPGPTSHSYISQRLKLHYVDWGNEDAPPLLLIHGGRDHCRNWDWVAEELRKDYHIIAPDLRGHGDSAWAIGGTYHELNNVYDIAQLVHQKKLAPVTVIAHSMGGSIGLLFSGSFPDQVKKVVAIEGLGPSPAMREQYDSNPIESRIESWAKAMRAQSARMPRRYKDIEAAIARMKEANAHLSDEQARHLTIHGASQNEDGTYSWKFDDYMRVGSGAPRLSYDDQYRLWARITCPVLLMRGLESWASDPVEDGRIKHFKNAKLANIANAGHWVHHDQLVVFLKYVREFLAD